MISVQYTTPAERETVMSANLALGYYLLADHTGLNGDTFLIFEDDMGLSSFNTATRTDVFVQKLISATPSEINAWIDANITNLSEAKELFKKLALIVSVLVKKVMR